MYGDSWLVHPDFWVSRPEVDYKTAYARARWLARILADVAGSEVAPEGLRLAVALYGTGWTVRADGTAIAWVGADPDDAELWGEIAPDAPVAPDADDLLAAA